MYAAVLFDMDGLMFDTEPIWAQSWEPVLERHGLHMAPDLFRRTIGSARSALPGILEQVYGHRDDLDEIADGHYELAYELLEGHVSAKPGLLELLDYLGGCGVPLAVASSSPRHLIERHLEEYHLEGRFSCIVDGSEVERSKPEPDIFLLAARRLGIDSRDSLVLEDSVNGLRAACTGGLPCIVVPDIQEPSPEDAAHAVAVCRDLFEVRNLLEDGVLPRRK